MQFRKHWRIGIAALVASGSLVAVQAGSSTARQVAHGATAEHDHRR